MLIEHRAFSLLYKHSIHSVSESFSHTQFNKMAEQTQSIELLPKAQQTQETSVSTPIKTHITSFLEIWKKIQTILRVVIVTVLVLVFIFGAIRQLLSPPSTASINNSGPNASDQILNKMVSLLEAIDDDIRIAPLGVQARSLTEWNQTAGINS